MKKMYCKRTLSVLFVAFVAIRLYSASVGIYYQNSLLPSSQYIYVYQLGELIESSYQYSTKEATFSNLASGVTYTYLTKTNHSGSITSTSSLKLSCAKVTIRILNLSNKPIVRENVKIYEDGEEVASDYTDEDGYAIFYLKPSDKYAYQCEFGMGKVGGAIANQETTITLQGLVLEVIPKYGNLPIPGTYELYEYGNSSRSSSSRYLYKYNDGVLRFNAISGKQYWIKTKYDQFSSVITPSYTNSRFYLEHKKVTFISNSTNPNILKSIMIGGQYGETRITDGQGYAVFYLLPGEYTYTHLAGSGKLTVDNQDQTINLSTSDVQVTLSGLSKGYQQFTVLDENGAQTTYTTNSSNKATIRVMGQKFVIRINGLGEWEGLASSSSVTIPVHTLTVKSNDTQSSLYLSDRYNNSIRIEHNKPISLIEGAYSLRHGNNTTEITLSSDKTIEASTYILELVVTDTNGTPVPYSTYYIYKEGNYVSQVMTGKDGVGRVSLDEGTYDLCYSNGEKITFFVLDYDDKVSITEPSAMTIQVLRKGQPYTGYVYFSEDYVTTRSVNCHEGSCQIRLKEGYYYVYNTGLSPYRKKIRVHDGAVIDFADIMICSEGMGLAFPLNYNDDVYQQFIKGESITLAAIPMDGYKFEYWEINGSRIEAARIEYQLVDESTKAIAHFSTQSTTEVSSARAESMEVKMRDNTLYFPQAFEGHCTIYDINGVVAKSVYLMSDRLSITDLPHGIYILSVASPDYRYTAKFTK